MWHSRCSLQWELGPDRDIIDHSRLSVTRDEVVLYAALLKNNTVVKTLDFSQNPNAIGFVKGKRTWYSLCRGLERNDHITELNCASCGLTSDSLKRLTVALSSNVSITSLRFVCMSVLTATLDANRRVL
jgi:hypothetical protein